MKKIKNQKKVELFFAIIMAFLLLISFFIKANIAVNDPPPQPGEDPEGYHRYATKIAEGWSLSAYEPPGQYYYLGLIYSLFGPSYITGRFSIIILSLISSVLVYHIAKLLFNKKIAMVAFVISLFDPLLVHYSSHIYSEMTYIFLILLPIFSSLKFLERKNYWYLILATVPIILATYIKAFTILMVPFLIIWISVNIKDKKTIAKSAFIILALTLLIIGGTTLRNYKKFDHLYFISVSNPLMLWFGNNPYGWGEFLENETTHEPFKGLDVYERSDKAAQLAFKAIKDHPKEFIKKNGVIFSKIWFKPYNEYRWFPIYYNNRGLKNTVRGYYTVLWILYLLGIILSFTLWKKNLLIYFHFITLSGAFMIVFLLERYRIPLLPFLIIYTSYCIWILKDKFLLIKKYNKKTNKKIFFKKFFRVT